MKRRKTAENVIILSFLCFLLTAFLCFLFQFYFVSAFINYESLYCISYQFMTIHQ